VRSPRGRKARHQLRPALRPREIKTLRQLLDHVERARIEAHGLQPFFDRVEMLTAFLRGILGTN